MSGTTGTLQKFDVIYKNEQLPSNYEEQEVGRIDHVDFKYDLLLIMISLFILYLVFFCILFLVQRKSRREQRLPSI